MCRSLAAVACALLGIACRPPAAPLEPLVDLIALFPYTDEAPPTMVIRPGDPADRAALVRGWTAPVTLADGTVGARIANERAATLAFHAGRKPQPFTLTIERVRDRPERLPARTAGRPRHPRRSRLLLHVNGQLVRRSVASLSTPEGVYEVPAEVLQAGRNLLSIGEPGTPRRTRAEDPPVSRWVYTRIRFDPRGAVASHPRVEGDLLLVPAGAYVSYFFRAPEDARLRFDVRAASATGEHLGATIRVDGAPRRVLLDREPVPGETVTVPLDVEPGVPVRLTLSFGAEAASRDGAIELLRPVIEGRRRASLDAQADSALGTRPNVILYLADTLRADRLGCYGARPSETPAIDRFAAESILFENAVAQAPWTRPSTATILTGHYPATHGAITLRTPVRSDLPTLATMLARAGWATQAFVTNLNVAPAFGFGQGFARYEYLPEDPRRPGVYEPASVLHEKALAWIAAHRNRPFLLYLHASDPHAPYRPTEPARIPSTLADEERDRLNRALNQAAGRLSDGEVHTLRTLYDGETAEFDAEFGRLLVRLAALGLMDDTLIVFVADHGEEFREHGALQHGRTLYREVLQVPLVIRLPGGRDGGRRVTTLARHVDLVPTVLALLGLPVDSDLPGTPLVGGGHVEASDEEALADTWFEGTALAGILLPPWKVVLPRAVLAARPEVYRLTDDPAERRNVAREHPVLIGYAKRRLAELETTRGALAPSDEAAPAVAPDALERLRALGYVVD